MKKIILLVMMLLAARSPAHAAYSSDVLGYTLFATYLSLNPVDATTYYFGGNFIAGPSTTADVWRIYIPKTGQITTAYVFASITGTLGTAETSTVSIRLNNTTDYAISSAVTLTATAQVFSSTTMNIPVVAGDYVEIKLAAPTWVTNPTAVVLNVTMYIE